MFPRSYKYFGLLLFYLLSTILFPSLAQGNYSRLLAEEQLPQQAINCIYQDSEGYLWVGTRSGLFRYDGFEVKHFVADLTDSTALVNNTVSGIIEDKTGNIWISTHSGLSVWKKREQQFLSSFNRHRVSGLCVDGDGILWGIVENHGVLRLESRQEVEDLDQYIHKTNVKNITLEGSYNLWGVGPADSKYLFFGSRKGLWTMDKKTFVLRRSEIPDDLIGLHLKNNRLWVARASGEIMELSLDSKSKEGFRINRSIPSPKAYGRITSFFLDYYDNLWIATQQGLFYGKIDIDGPFHSFEESGDFLNNNQVLTATTDHQGGIWLGTLKGVAVIKQQNAELEHRLVLSDDYFPINNHVISIYFGQQTQRLWLVVQNEGLFWYNPATDEFHKPELPADIPDQSLHLVQETKTELLLGFEDKVAGLPLSYFDQKIQASIDLKIEGVEVTPILEVAPGEWWAGSWRNGLQRFFEKNASDSLAFFRKIRQAIGETHPVYCLLKDHRNHLWIGTRGGGIYRADLETGVLDHYDKTNGSGLQSNGVLCILEDRQGRIWVGTRGGGLHRFLSDVNQFISFGLAEGLPDLTICDLEEMPNGDIWMSTEKGLARYLPGQDISFLAYDRRDGVFNTEFSYLAGTQDQEGNTYFGSQVGITILSGLDTLMTSPPAKVVFTGFNILDDNKKNSAEKTSLSNLLNRKKIDLDHAQNSFSISFSSLDFQAPHKLRYAYQLVGYDPDWQYEQENNRIATYYDVPAGNYTFKLKGSNSDGIWISNQPELQINIRKHFLKSDIALTAYALISFLLLTAALILRRRWQKMAEKLEAEKALIRKQKRQMVFFSDISHEIRNRLTLILGPLEKVLEGKEIDQASVQRIYQNAQRLKRLSDRVMEVRKTESGQFRLQVSQQNVDVFMRSVHQEIADLTQVRGIQYQYAASLAPNPIFFDAHVLEIILLNLLNNAIKYTPEGGKVSVRIEYVFDKDHPQLPAGNCLKFAVKDNGIGIPKEDLEHIFKRFFRSKNNEPNVIAGTGIGLDLVARLINLHHGIIQVESEEGEYTEVQFTIPVDAPHYHQIEKGMQEKEESLSSSPVFSDNGEEKRMDGATILIVEDNWEVRELIRESLEEEFRVLEATDGSEGFEKAKSEKPDLILSDLVMPKMDGIGLLTQVRAHEELKHLPFLILTARYSEEQKMQALKSQVDDFLEKPFSGEMLRWRIKNLLQSRHLLKDKFGQDRAYILEPDTAGEYLSADEEFLQNLSLLMEEHLADSFLNVEFLASKLAMSRPTLYRHMERLLKDAPANFIKKYRLKKAALFLQENKLQISEVAYMTGFNNPKYFTKCFQKEFGCTPSEYVRSLTEV